MMRGSLRLAEPMLMSKEHGAGMQQYFFRFADGDQPSDVDGVELPDLAAARLVAMDIIAERLKGNGRRFWDFGRWELTVADSSGAPLLVVSLWGEEVATD